MQVRINRKLAGVLAMFVIVGGGYAWMHGSAREEHAAVKLTPPAAPALGTTLPAPVQAPGPMPIPASIVESDQSLRVQVDRLLANHDPESAYAAYFLVSACTTFNANRELKLYDNKLHAQRDMTADEQRHMTRLCGEMTERERQSRLDYLAIAVKAGVPGAAWAFASEGPFGDPSALKTRPDDPLVKEWKAQAVTQLTEAAEAGDLATLMIWGMQNLSGSDLTDKHPELGYGYLLAFGFIAGEGGKDEISAQLYKDGSAMMDAFAYGLTVEQRTAAITAAQRIARNVNKK